MLKKNKEIINIVLLAIISFLLLADLFVNKGQSATFDGWTHLTNMAMFYKSLKLGELPVSWTDGFANYGMPLGTLAQQTTSYLGAIINFATNNILLSYNIVFFVGAVLSTIFFYFFLRNYFNEKASFFGAFLFNFAPYRIINIYIRGAVPEFFASVFLPLILIGIYLYLEKKNVNSLLLIVVATAFTILTHPFMIVIYSFIILPYILFNLFGKKDWLWSIIWIGGAFGFGVLLSGYFIIPLAMENKYFYYGLSKNHFVPGHFLGWANFFDYRWFYFYKGDIFTRGHFMKTGILELLVLLVCGWGLVSKKINQKKDKLNKLIVTVIVSSLFIFFFLIKLSEIIYKNINLFGNIQHPWRLLSAFIFLPPIALSFLINRLDATFFAPRQSLMKIGIFFSLLFLICLFRFPQLYGKNYTLRLEKDYFSTLENLHGQILNTIWTGPTDSYPIKKNKGEIIEGKGKITMIEIKNNQRKYFVEAQERLRLADYTFYFPGWRVFIDGRETEIQFQDPAYRGVITYYVPKGEHQIKVIFKDTKVRLISKLISATSLILLLTVIIINNKFNVKNKS